MRLLKPYTNRYLPILLGGLLSCSLMVRAETVSVNFRDAEMDAVIESIAAVTGQTFIVDPRVKGKITIVSPEPLEASMLYEVFLSTLQVHGFQAVNDGAAVRIIPGAKAVNVPSGILGSELGTEVISLDFAKAAEVMPVLKPLMSQGAQLSFHADSNKLVVTDSKSQIIRIKQILKELDSPDAHGFEIIPLANTSASELVEIANTMGILNEQSKIVDDVASNRLIISGTRKARDQFKALIRALDTKGDDNSGVDVIYLNYAKAEDIQPVLENMLKSSAFLSMSGEKPKQDASSYAIQADKANNALIIAASSGVTTAIKAIVSKLDRPRAQVLIEAVIAEVSEEFFNDLSVNLAQVGNSGVFLSDFTGTLTSIGGALLSGSDSDKADAVAGLNGRAVAGGVSIDKDGNGGIGGIIEAIKGDTKSTLLSTPSILTLENEEATISIGQEVPFITGSYTTTSSGSTNPFQTIEREEVGTILKVTPWINQDDGVRLDISQEVSSVDQTNVVGSSETDIRTDKKVIETKVIVDNNQMLVLGGLMDNKFTNTDSKVPLLGDIPLLGHLFRSSSRTKDTRVLMIFIRPTIIRDATVGRELSDRKYRLLKGTHQEFVERNKYDKEIKPLPETLQDVKQVEDLMN